MSGHAIRFVKLPLAAAVAAALMSSAAPGEAQSLRERLTMHAAEQEYASVAARTNAACGTELTTAFDWESFQSEDLASGISISGLCQAPLDAIRGLCTSAGDNGIGQQMVQERLSHVICARGEQRGIAVEDGTLRYWVPLSPVSEFQYATEYLLDNL